MENFTSIVFSDKNRESSTIFGDRICQKFNLKFQLQKQENNEKQQVF